CFVLSSLRIENIAVIEKAEITFTAGFCVLTGETGAGKSILIDSLNAVLGGRTSKDLVRQGCEKAAITALFEDCSDQVVALAEEMGYPAQEGSLLLTRTITVDGRSVFRINGLPANGAIIRQLAVELINIHGQQDNHALLDPSSHGGYIDSMLADPSLVFRYREAYDTLKNLKNTLADLKQQEQNKAVRMDMLTYQIAELENANLQIGEYEQLTARKKMVTNSEKIASTLSAVTGLLGGDELQSGGVDSVKRAAEYLTECGKYLALSDLDNRLMNLGYELEEVYEEVRSLTEDLVFDPRELSAIEERLDVLYRLSKKYGENEEQMLAFLENAREELDSLTDADATCAALEKEIGVVQKNAEILAEELSKARKQTAQTLDQAIGEELSFLNMPNVVFQTGFNPCDLYAGGSEKMEFLISANPGEPPKPLSKIASGGELSRIMLAIISVLTKENPVATLIFDEIDAGISGRAALKVGDRLKRTAQHHQVICITHLAQIAAKAHSHYLIEKRLIDERANTVVTPIEGDARLQELARIIGGEQVTPASLQTARELINQTVE
ncbi:MAG: DNA repair protein RecN, partial [Clostridia bacterium]|nr:DNA repair protein RecN [Clostridia bacterium]